MDGLSAHFKSKFKYLKHQRVPRNEQKEVVLFGLLEMKLEIEKKIIMNLAARWCVI